MSFSAIFIRRPVLSTVLAFLILLLGFQGLFNLQVRQYPEVEETVITITTVYPGASADLIQGFITAPISAAVSTTENVDYVSSQSRPSASVVTVQMRLGSDPDAALTEVISKVQQVRSQLPADAEDPTIAKGTGMQFATMYLALQNPNMSAEQVTEYIERVIRPRMSTIPGVAQVEIMGAANYSMRVWVDPVRLAARGMTASEVLAAINSSNFLAAPGKTRNEYVTYPVTMESTLQTPEAFAGLPLKATGDEVVRLGDVARVELAAESTDMVVTFNGQPGTFIGVFPTPSANPLDTASAVLDELPAIQNSLPDGMTITLMYDATESISASIAVPATPDAVSRRSRATKTYGRRSSPPSAGSIWSQPRTPSRSSQGDSVSASSLPPFVFLAFTSATCFTAASSAASSSTLPFPLAMALLARCS